MNLPSQIKTLFNRNLQIIKELSKFSSLLHLTEINKYIEKLLFLDLLSKIQIFMLVETLSQLALGLESTLKLGSWLS